MDPSGTWELQLYDELPGDPPAGDGRNVATSGTGGFYSEFGGIGRMVGSFGVTKE